MELNHLSSGYEPDEIPFLYSALFWGTRIRTWTNGVKVRCPTIRRFPNVSKLTNNYIIFCPAFSSGILEKIHHTHSRLLLGIKKAPILWRYWGIYKLIINYFSPIILSIKPYSRASFFNFHHFFCFNLNISCLSWDSSTCN